MDTTLRFLGDPDAAVASIDLLITKLEQAAAKSAKLFASASNANQQKMAEASAQASERIATANTRAAQSTTAAADATLRHEQAFARLLQAQGKSEDAIKTLQKALDGFTGSEIQAVRAQIQLTNLQNDYANSPLITAVRSQTAALNQFGAANLNVEQVLKNTAQASQQVGDSLADSTNATIAQAQAIAQLQTLSGDAAGATNTLALGLRAVSDQQAQAVQNTEKLTTKVTAGIQAGAAILNVISAGFNFFSAIQKEATAGLTEAEAAAKVVSKAFQGSKAAVDAVKNAITSSVPAVQKLSAEQQAAADREFARTGERLSALAAELQRRREIGAEVAKQATAKVQAVAVDPNFGPAFLARIKQINAAMVKAGQDAATGFSQGVRSGAPTAEKSGETLGKAAEQGTKKSLDISSPSKVMFRVGQDAVKGFAQGFDDGKKGIKPIGSSDLTVNFGNAIGQATNRLKSLLGTQTAAVSKTVSDASASLDNLQAVSLATAGSVGQLAVAFGPAIVAIGLLTAAAIPATRALIEMGQAGIATNAQLETLQTGITTVIASVAEIRNSEGVQLKGIDAINASLPIAADQLRKLRIDSLETSATLADIAPAFQAAIGPGLVAGLTIDQIRENTIKLTQAVTALGLPLDQIKQETRAILTGDINRNTQAAIALGITKEAVAEAQKQGKFAEFLEQKLSAAAAAGKVVAQTFAAAQSNLREAADTFQAVVTEGLFDQLRDKANAILPQIFDKSATNLISKNFEGIVESFTRVFDTAGQSIGKAIEFIFNGLKQISAFLDANQETVGAIIESVNQIVVILADTIVSVGQIVISAAGGSAEFRSMADVLGAIVRVVGFIADGIKIVTSAAFTLGGVIRVAILAPLELAVTIMSRLFDFVPGLGGALKGFSESLTTARQAATAGLSESAKAFGSAVINVGKTSSDAIARIEEARKRAALGQRAIPGLDRTAPGATGATFRPPKRRAEDEDGSKAAAAARKQGQAELKLQQAIEKQTELNNKRIAAALQTSLQDRLVSLETFTELAIENDRELLEKRLASLDIEQKAAERSVKTEAEREAKRAEFALKRATLQQEFDISAEEKRDNLRRTIEKAEADHQRRLADVRDIGRKTLEASIREQQRVGDLSASQATERTLDLERQRFADREALLKQDLEATKENAVERQRVQDELAKLAAERAGFEEEASRRVRAAIREELGELRAFVSERRQLQDDLRASADAALQRNADALARLAQIRPGAISAAIQAQLQADIAAANTQHELALRQIDEQNSVAQNLAQTSEQYLEIERLSNEARLAEQARFEAERKAIREKARQESLLADPSSPLSIFGQSAQLVADQGANAFQQFAASANEALASVSAQATNMQGILQGAFSGIAQGLGQMVQAFILTGQTGPAAFKKLAAGVIAAVASQAAVKAIFEVAEGLAALARAFFGDPRAGAEAALHFKAAAIYGTVAGIAGLAGRAIAGGGGSGSSGGGGFVQEGQYDQSGRTIEQGGALPGREPIVIQIRARMEEGVIIEKFDEDYRNNGRTRARVRADVLNEQ